MLCDDLDGCNSVWGVVRVWKAGPRGKGYVYRIHFLVQETQNIVKQLYSKEKKRKHYNALILKK